MVAINSRGLVPWYYFRVGIGSLLAAQLRDLIHDIYRRSSIFFFPSKRSQNGASRRVPLDAMEFTYKFISILMLK